MSLIPTVFAHGEEKHEAAQTAAGSETGKAELSVAPTPVTNDTRRHWPCAV
jgi:hypothetical protein